MSIQAKLEIVCDSCRKRVRFDPSLVGKTVLCPGCKGSLVLTNIGNSYESIANETVHIADIKTDTARHTEAAVRNSPVPSKSPPSRDHQILGGRYELVRCLGKGGFGEVWEAVDRHLNRTVAIKLPRFLPNEHKKIERFLREGRSAAGLRHPNIVSVFDAAETNGQHYLAIEFVDGKPLSEFGAERKLKHAHAAKLIAELARALHYAHSQKIIHRDIKPQNVVVNLAGCPQILDFGLAKSLAEEAALTIDGTVMGTPAYMSPEQARGEIKNVGPASDQYSLGASLYWLLTGQPLFSGPPQAVLVQVVGTSPQAPKVLCAGLDDRLNAICLKSISKLPSDRYSSCLEMARDLDRYLNDEVVEARPIGPLGRAFRWAKRNRLEAGLVIATSLLLTISTSISLTGYWRSTTLLAEAGRLEETAQVALKDIERTKSELQSQTNILGQAKTRSEQAKIQLVEVQRSAEESEAQFRKLVAENEVLQAKSKNQLELISKNESQSVQINSLAEKTQSEAVQAAANSLATKPQTDRLLNEAFSAIDRRRYSDAEKILSTVAPQFRDIRWRLQINVVKWNGKLPIVKKSLADIKQKSERHIQNEKLFLTGLDASTKTLQLAYATQKTNKSIFLDTTTGIRKDILDSTTFAREPLKVNSRRNYGADAGEFGESDGVLFVGQTPVCRIRDEKDEKFVSGCASKEMELLAFLTKTEVIIVTLNDLD